MRKAHNRILTGIIMLSLCLGLSAWADIRSDSHPGALIPGPDNMMNDGGAATAKKTGIAGFPETLITPSPEAGFQLAIKLSRLGVKATQPNISILKKIRPKYAKDPKALIAVSQTIAMHYQTIAAANNYWR